MKFRIFPVAAVICDRLGLIVQTEIPPFHRVLGHVERACRLGQQAFAAGASGCRVVSSDGTVLKSI